VPCPFTGELLFLFLFFVLLLLLLLMMMMKTMDFLLAGTYFRIGDFIGSTFLFVITDGT